MRCAVSSDGSVLKTSLISMLFFSPSFSPLLLLSPTHPISPHPAAAAAAAAADMITIPVFSSHTFHSALFLFRLFPFRLFFLIPKGLTQSTAASSHCVHLSTKYRQRVEHYQSRNSFQNDETDREGRRKAVGKIHDHEDANVRRQPCECTFRSTKGSRKKQIKERELVSFYEEIEL